MKFRLLSDDELKVFDEDLKHFLIANGIDGTRWAEINAKAPEKALELIKLFSDTVLQKVYEKINFLEFRAPECCYVFKLDKKHIELIGIRGSENVDLSTPEQIHLALSTMPEELQFFTTEKRYNEQREKEIHKMLNEGCVPSHEAFWIQLKKAIQQ